MSLNHVIEHHSQARREILARARQLAVAANTSHGNRGRASTSGAYKSWCSMIARCYNPKQDNYSRYGGRGITVCPQWREDFSNFLADMGERPSGLSLDRIDSNGNYEPSNCRWATWSQQRRNQIIIPKTICKRGHPQIPSNLYINPKDGSRSCNICKGIAREEWRKRKLPYPSEEK